jgi:glycosyltransferase involved in cell wall biosynthesis
MPLFSVIVPIYNKGRYLQRCLGSVLRQTVTDFEIIAVDDGSTDDSRAILENISDPRLRVIVQSNQGVSSARNRGIAEATGNVVAFLDADDEWHPLFLEAIRDLRQSHTDAGILATGYRRCFGREYGVDREVTLARRGVVSDYLRLALLGNFVTSSSAAVPRSVIERLGGFPAGEPLGEDREFWLRIALRYPVAYDSRILAVYHSEAEGRACDVTRGALRFPPIVRTLQEALDNNILPGHRMRDGRRLLDLMKMQHVYRHLESGDVSGARRLLRVRYDTFRFDLEAFLLRASLGCLPVRVVLALKRKPLNIWIWLRQPTIAGRIIGSGEMRLGRDLVVRIVPQTNE